MRDALRFPDMPGNYLALSSARVTRWIRPDIEELVKLLVRPSDTGRRHGGLRRPHRGTSTPRSARFNAISSSNHAAITANAAIILELS
jgi:hypothetical protein